MAKTNYTKVEDALAERLHKMKVEQLLELTEQKKQEDAEAKKLNPRQMMIVVAQELKWMKKNYPDAYNLLKINKKDLKRLEEASKSPPDTIKAEDLQEIEKLLLLVKKFKRKTYKDRPEERYLKQIENEKERHIYKRHNVNEKWLPLDTH